ncbi:hypothetical protein [Aequorivita marina]|uniref:hypothetical protein n=1 Tax=Aequorivita marina TaxID=3073654 RepID=UPI0028747094|nr:hypothetical protein [Aequorivita sp. S2608]MDS1299488.1 hypothetical protein [Aequorivita sp. S2608]
MISMSCFGQLDNGLVAHYPFNGNANDMTGNTNTAVVHGASLVDDRAGNAESPIALKGKLIL